MAKLSVVESVAELQADNDATRQSMTFNHADCRAMAAYARKCVQAYTAEAAYVRLNKIGGEQCEDIARALEREAITAELLSNIIRSQVG